jgi:hypothetical protein
LVILVLFTLEVCLVLKNARNFLIFFFAWVTVTLLAWVIGAVVTEFLSFNKILPTTQTLHFFGSLILPSVFSNTVASIVFKLFRRPYHLWLITSLVGCAILGFVASSNLVVMMYLVVCLAQSISLCLIIGLKGLFWLLSSFSQMLMYPLGLAFIASGTRTLIDNPGGIIGVGTLGVTYGIISCLAVLLSGVWVRKHL